MRAAYPSPTIVGGGLLVLHISQALTHRSRTVTPPWALHSTLIVISPDIVGRLDPVCPAISGVNTQTLRP
jgi:hypothetical protein